MHRDAAREYQRKRREDPVYREKMRAYLGPPTGRWDTFAVDHDHLTGTVRGLLCSTCNKALGLLKDDPAVLLRAAQYLEQYRKTIPGERRRFNGLVQKQWRQR